MKAQVREKIRLVEEMKKWIAASKLPQELDISNLELAMREDGIHAYPRAIRTALVASGYGKYEILQNGYCVEVWRK